MITELLQQLPHRYPFLLLDRIVELDAGKAVTAIKNVTVNEPCFMGHFPGQPIFPGVLILEAMAQSTTLITRSSPDFEKIDGEYHLFAGVDKARFKRVVIPGDQIVIKTTLLKYSHGISKFESHAYVDDNVVCKAQVQGALRRLSNDAE